MYLFNSFLHAVFVKAHTIVKYHMQLVSFICLCAEQTLYSHGCIFIFLTLWNINLFMNHKPLYQFEVHPAYSQLKLSLIVICIVVLSELFILQASDSLSSPSLSTSLCASSVIFRTQSSKIIVFLNI